jgi:hypothetical protein
VERNGINSYPDHTRRHFIVVRYYSKSLGFSIQSFSYTRSILSARLQFSTVAIFLGQLFLEKFCDDESRQQE